MTKKQLLNNFYYYFASRDAYKHGYKQLEGYQGAYINASIYKWRAWEFWREYFLSRGIHNFKILGRNCMYFSIGAYDEQAGFYYHITPSYNYKYNINTNEIVEF